MKTRNMEESVIPSGFETFSLDKLDANFLFEEMQNENKELVLISAPADFDMNTLKGEQYIMNGSRLLNTGQPENEGSFLKWELHSSSASYDTHLNILLPSKVQHKHILTDALSVSLNVIRDIQIPSFKSPKKNKSVIRLPKPSGLKARWKPYGSDCPESNKKLDETNDHCLSEEFESNVKKEKKRNIEEYTMLQGRSEIENDEHTVNGDNNKKHKKKKKKSKLQENYDEDIDRKPEATLFDINESSMQVVSTETENAVFTVNGDNNKKHKKKKKKSKLEENYNEDIDRKPEATLFDKSDINESRMQVVSTELKNAVFTVNGDNNKKHKKKKKKSKLEECGNEDEDQKTVATNINGHSMQEVKIEIENDGNTMNINNIKKRKKKRKKTKLHECDDESVDGTPGTTSLDTTYSNEPEESLKHIKSKSKTNRELSVSNTTILESSKKKRAKKRKKKTITSDETCNKKQKLVKQEKDTNNESFKLSVANFDSDLDSDSEARIFGLIPKQRMFSS